ncbi:MAG: GNAT family N-acetyltransferase [Spirochaetales bacterium]|nr:GNAT family N-acetyltransferase [Spirochaetales bacterium]
MFPIETVPGDEIPRHLLFLADEDGKRIGKYRSSALFFAVRKEGQVIGMIGLRENSPGEMEIVTLAVDEAAQNGGLGTALLEHAIAYAREKGYRDILIKTGNSSIGQLYLYQSCGFRLESIKRNHFTENYEEPIFEKGIPCRDQLILRYRIYSSEELAGIEKSYWDRFTKDHPEYAGWTYDSWMFCSGEKLPNRLMALVKTGMKRATSSAEELYEPDEEKPFPGSVSLVTYGNGLPGCIIETEEVLHRKFLEVSEEEARLEGEGDLSLDYWRREHEKHFRREYARGNRDFSFDIPVIYERFRVIFNEDALQ